MIGRAIHNLATNVIAPEARQFYDNHIAPNYVPGTETYSIDAGNIVSGNLSGGEAFRNAVNAPLNPNNSINQGIFSLISSGNDFVQDKFGLDLNLDKFRTLRDDLAAFFKPVLKGIGTLGDAILPDYRAYADNNLAGAGQPISYDHRNYIANIAGHTSNMRNMGLDPKDPPPQNSGLISDFDILNRMMDSTPSHPKAPRYSTFSPDVYGSKLMEEDLGMNAQGQYTQDEHDMMYNYAQMMKDQQGGG